MNDDIPIGPAFLLLELAYFSLYILQARAALGVSGQVTAAPLSISARLLAVSPWTQELIGLEICHKIYKNFTCDR